MQVLSDLDVAGKKVFVRADLDVPLVEERRLINKEKESHNLEVETATRLTNLKPSVDYLVDNGASRIIIAGHINRPEKPDPALSTKNLFPHLETILGQKIAFSEQLTIDNLQLTGKDKSNVNGQRSIVLLENLRFWPGEVANDVDFAKELASLADIYINEAFGNCHRVHASMVALPELLPRAAGIHLNLEIHELSRVLVNPKSPLIAIVGGAKIETKVPVIQNLAKVADTVLVGGILPDEIQKKQFDLPRNVVVAKLAENGDDISSRSAGEFVNRLKSAKMVVWNGPLGKFEQGYVDNSLKIARAIIDSGAYSIVGGGDTTRMLSAQHLIGQFSFVSAGGGAMLEFLAGNVLPGLKALD